MTIESLKNVNITGLFSSPLDHLLISADGIVKLFSGTQNLSEVKKSVIEAPGLKVIILPELKKEFIFESIRVVVGDKSETTPDKSSIIDDFQKLIDNNFIDLKKLTAYGFNFDAIVVPGETFKISDIIGSKLSQFSNISSAGIHVGFEKNNLKYNFDLTPLGVENKYLAHLNAHITQDLPDSTEIKKQLEAQYKEFEELISKI